MQVSILKESITNYKQDNIEIILNKLFIEMIKPTFSIEMCNYAIKLLNNLISNFNSILKCNINDLKIDNFIFIEDLKIEAVSIFKNFNIQLYNKNQKTSYEIDIIKKYIEKNFLKQLTIENIANFIGFNKNYLCTKFKNETGMTIHQYLILIRIKHAKELLITSDYSIENVASGCGFYNIIYFRTIFKKNTGLTPTTFRGYYGNQS